jgi:predicted metal-dependent phosphoesterase TrpH
MKSETLAGVIKVDLHIHTADDPVDAIPYSSADLIDRAAALGYGALAITLHERQLESPALADYAAARGVVLIPGIERTIDGKHVLLINFSRRTEEVRTFRDLARLKAREAGLVVAPHAYYPAASCLRGALDRHADLFDAVEYNAMFTRSLNFNRPAEAWAARLGKPMVGNGDVHRLRQLGTTWSLVDVAPGADAGAICEAIAAGRVRVAATPLAWRDATSIMVDLLAWRTHAGPRIETLPASGSTNISLPQSA